jgi:hypothetical protein
LKKSRKRSGKKGSSGKIIIILTGLIGVGPNEPSEITWFFFKTSPPKPPISRFLGKIRAMVLALT